MVKKVYDKDGNLVNTIKTRADEKREQKNTGLFVVFVAAIALPVMLATWTYEGLVGSGLHSLFSFLLALIVFVGFGSLYFINRISSAAALIMSNIFSTYWVFELFNRAFEMDGLWSGFLALVFFGVVGLVLHYWWDEYIN
jgi:glucan phosphoethanolaminetransferase (alkaline phosphatase superfamily)